MHSNSNINKNYNYYKGGFSQTILRLQFFFSRVLFPQSLALSPSILVLAIFGMIIHSMCLFTHNIECLTCKVKFWSIRNQSSIHLSHRTLCTLLCECVSAWVRVRARLCTLRSFIIWHPSHLYQSGSNSIYQHLSSLIAHTHTHKKCYTYSDERERARDPSSISKSLARYYWVCQRL